MRLLRVVSTWVCGGQVGWRQERADHYMHLADLKSYLAPDPKGAHRAARARAPRTLFPASVPVDMLVPEIY